MVATPTAVITVNVSKSVNEIGRLSDGQGNSGISHL